MWNLFFNLRQQQQQKILIFEIISIILDQSHPQENVRNHHQRNQRQRFETSSQQIVRILFLSEFVENFLSSIEMMKNNRRAV